MQAKTRKYYNFFTDIARVIFYVLLIVFVEPFATGSTTSTMITVSFWIYLVALALFTVRKIIKWQYYLRDKEGSKICTPWENKSVVT